LILLPDLPGRLPALRNLASLTLQITSVAPPAFEKYPAVSRKITGILAGFYPKISSK
jgi:hypothetical protein